MNYIVIDLEWNQAMSSKSSVFNKLPIRLRGEIIEIGAVKLTDGFLPGEEFKIDVCPVYFRRMHYKVKKLTGFDKERMMQGECFTMAMEKFRAWCGENCTFLTWGYDDQGIMEQNIIIHDLDWDWIAGWVNLQLIYNYEMQGDRNQKSLATAMEHFEIEQTRTAHDALGDAYNTALVASKLDLSSSLPRYAELAKEIAARLPKETSAEKEGPPVLTHDVFGDFPTKAAAFDSPEALSPACPSCGVNMKALRWVSQGDQRYMNLCECPEHGKFLLRLKFKKSPDTERWSLNRLIYGADAKMEAYYLAKASQRRSHRRGGRSKAKKKTNEAS